ncbi:hemolysin XhlA family protein [Oceanobacillus sp. 1P07AA]|uniref:hemolysin XhlA family protein n=1 Tax=Oceanobacillus sp. 1P07AA TaxID=3132293 RepID=UPI0039A52AB4
MLNKEVEPMDKTQQDILEIRNDIKNIKDDVNRLQMNDAKQDEKIVNLQSTLASIQDDTKWIRRMITKAIVTALITGIISGAIALFLAKF